MFLVQILLPLRDNDDHAFPSALFEAIEREMTHRFGGVTTYVRAPASGAFRDARGRVMQDDVVVVEVMCRELDRTFWREYREQLTALFAQEELVVRALPFERL